LEAGEVMLRVSRVAAWAAMFWGSARWRVQTVMGALIAGRLALPILIAVVVGVVVIEVGSETA
jgi:hypothetical protein